ncbi:MAG: ABC transporter permease, partial [Clostridium sp.]|nr:ABC transporter permease [Clostridium sp.]
MKTPLFKSTLREIKGSLGRFLSIFFIVTLGVSFFSGINASAPDMKATADRYFDKYNLMDLQIMSTLGLDEEDIKAIEDIDEVKAVMKGYSLDAIAVRGNSQSVLRVHGIPLDKSLEDDSYINRPRLMEGRLPEKSGECVVEEDTFGKDFIKLGDTIKLSLGSDSDIKESLKTDEYKVVGVVNSPYYSTYEKGNSNIGSGKISQYIMVPEDDFSLPVYTEANVILKGAKELFTYGE